ncbi:uncharacterized protein [Clytia hemisphaerica]|uniref:Uncharacterized protein n=1 Tax=Clytia hemisphaerica TaxID=252671 RepID=A0A7M5XF65_9CNID|eukprot:TCONS_00016004-protein
MYKCTSLLTVLLDLQSLAFAAHYLSIYKQNGVVLPSEDSQNIDARSQIECILKCRTKLNKKNGFYTEKNSCFCSNGSFEASSDDGGQIGATYYEIQKHKVIPFSQHFSVEKVQVAATTIEESLQNIIPQHGDNWQLTFKTWRNDSSPNAYIIRLTADPIDMLKLNGHNVLYVFMRYEELRVRITRLRAEIQFPENQEIDVKIVNYACAGCPTRHKIFLDGVEKFSQATPSKIFHNVSCFAPDIFMTPHEATKLKYISNVPLFESEQSYDKTTQIATIPQWPAGNSTFHVSFELKIDAWTDDWKILLSFSLYGTESSRLPSFYVNNKKILASYKIDNRVYAVIGVVDTSKITLGKYHKISLRQVIDEMSGSFYVNLYFDDELVDSKLNTVPELTFSDVRVRFHNNKKSFLFSFKKFDYSTND